MKKGINETYFSGSMDPGYSRTTRKFFSLCVGAAPLGLSESGSVKSTQGSKSVTKYSILNNPLTWSVLANFGLNDSV